MNNKTGARLALIRHPALRISPGTCYGRRDYPLADPAEIPLIVQRLGKLRPEEVIASPAGRCRQLAEAIPGRLTYDPRLLELDFGDWEGVPWSDIDRADLDRWAADPRTLAPPGGETGQSLIDRVTACYKEIRARATDHAIVTHGGPLKVLTCLARGSEIDLQAESQTFGSVTIVNPW